MYLQENSFHMITHTAYLCHFETTPDFPLFLNNNNFFILIKYLQLILHIVTEIIAAETNGRTAKVAHILKGSILPLC